MNLRWRIRDKLIAGVVLVVGMFALLSGGAFYGLYSYRHSNKTFDNHHRQLQLLSDLVQAVADLRADPPQSAANDPRPGRLGNIERCLVHYRKNLERAAVGGFASSAAEEQHREIDELLRIVMQIRSQLPGQNAAADSDAPHVFRSWFTTGVIPRLLDRLQTSLYRLRGHTHLEVNQNVELDRANYRTAMGIVYSTSVLVLVLLGLLVVLGYRAVFNPIRHLHRGVVKLAARQFDSRVKLDTGDEMEELGGAFNDMADKLQAMYRDLNGQVEDRSRQLIRSERLASVGFLAAGVAHEINNPLASIAFCAEALQGRLVQFLPNNALNTDAEVIRNYLRMIEQEAFRCKAITDKLLDFSRSGDPERLETDVVALVRDVLEMVQHLGRTKGKNVRFEPTQSVFCSANPQELKQVLLNLVVNALESVDDDGTVEVQVRNLSDQVEIKVTDDGCGMAPDVLENLFEPFFTRSRTGKGTGLGLSISHLIVSQHSGTLEASSGGVGKGSTFAVRLPLRAAVRRAA